MKRGFDGEGGPGVGATFLFTNIREKQDGTSESFVEHIPGSRNWRSRPRLLMIQKADRCECSN